MFAVNSRIDREDQVTIGLAVGDRYTQVFGVDVEGEIIEKGRLGAPTGCAVQSRSLHPELRGSDR